MQNRVLVLDANRRPLSPCHPARARELLRAGKAALFRRFPYTIILHRAVDDAQPQPIQLKIDPGAKTTGMALVQQGKVIWAAELTHRGQAIREALRKRRVIRRSRRQRKTRYRQPRFLHRTRPAGWLAPSLKNTAAVNATRWATWRMFNETGLPVEVGTGGRTKFNRTRQGYPKAHWIDAACVGQSGEQVHLRADHQPLQIQALGRGLRRVCNVDAFGFPRGKPKLAKRVYGFQSGDIVRALVPAGNKRGEYVGTVSVRSSGSFKINGKADGINHRYCRVLHCVDGYGYQHPA